jgi:antitoxin component of MazEF toxin-antitoxin module
MVPQARPGAEAGRSSPAILALDAGGADESDLATMVRLTTLSRNGNSLAISVPHAVLAELGWPRGTHLACRAQDGALEVRMADEARLFETSAPRPKVRVRRNRKR